MFLLNLLRSFLTTSWPRVVGMRYLKSKRNSNFLSFISLISVAGVTLGVCALIVVLSVMDGFEKQLRSRLMSNEMHIRIAPTADHKDWANTFITDGSLEKEKWFNDFKSSSVVHKVVPVVQTEAILRSTRKVSGVVIKGMPQREYNDWRLKLVETSDESGLRDVLKGDETQTLSRVLVGQELAFEMGLYPEDELTLISPIETDGPLGNIPRMKKVVVEGIYKSGLPEQELHTVFTLDKTVRSFLRKDAIISHYEVILNRFDDAPTVAFKLQKETDQYLIQDWMSMNSHLFASLKLERLAMFISLAFIVIVASFNIISTLTMMVMEKRKEISILQAMGARSVHIGAIFLTEGLLIGVGGVLAGLLSGFGICVILKKYQIFELPDVYVDRTLPVSFLPEYYFIIGFVALVIVLIAAVFPSVKASKYDPLASIRDSN